jgi:hypothetical protein
MARQTLVNTNVVLYLFLALGLLNSPTIVESFTLRIVYSGQTKGRILPVEWGSQNYCSPEFYEGNILLPMYYYLLN